MAISTKRLRRTNPNLISYIPGEVITNILVKLPMKTILSCKLVCKEWRRIILLDSHFAEEHFKNSRISLVSYWKNYHKRDNKIVMIERCRSKRKFERSLKFNLGFLNNQDFDIVNSCRGFLLLRIIYHFWDDPPDTLNMFHMWNPLTNEYMILPDMHPRVIEESYYAGLGFSPTKNQYKVVRFVSLPNTYIVVETLTLGTNEWRSIKQDNYQLILQNIWLSRCHNPIELNGVLHWLAWAPSRMNVIVCFNVDKEEVGLIELTCVKDSSKYMASIGVFDSLLCIGIATQGNSDFGLELWVMKNYGVQQSWTPYIVIENSKFGLRNSSFTLVEVRDNGEEVFLYPSGHLIAYNPMKKSFKLLRVPGANSRAKVQHFVPSFFSLTNISTSS